LTRNIIYDIIIIYTSEKPRRGFAASKPRSRKAHWASSGAAAKEKEIMALRDDIKDLTATEIQRFREELLTEKELEEIMDDVTAFCIIEIRKFCGEDIFEVKAQELKDKGIDKAKEKVKVNLKKMS